MKKKIILFWLKDGVATDEQRELARTIGAQFRNSYYADPENPEKCDFVLGDVPEGYEEVPRYSLKGKKAAAGSTDTPDNEKSPKGASEDEDQEEVEITSKYIKGLTKPDLIELAEDEEITLTGEETVPDLKKLLLEHFELQE